MRARKYFSLPIFIVLIHIASIICFVPDIYSSKTASPNSLEISPLNHGLAQSSRGEKKLNDDGRYEYAGNGVKQNKNMDIYDIQGHQVIKRLDNKLENKPRLSGK